MILHGGGGPQTVTGFADLLAAAKPARVITPTHLETFLEGKLCIAASRARSGDDFCFRRSPSRVLVNVLTKSDTQPSTATSDPVMNS